MTDKLAEGLRNIAEGQPLGEAPVDILVVRGRKRRRNRSLLMVCATSAALALVAVGTTVLLRPSSTPPPIDRAATPPSAATNDLAAAAAATANTTYKLRYTETLSAIAGATLTESDQRYLEQQGKPLVSQGAYDRSAFTGYLVTPQRGGGSTREQRLVRGEQFVGPVGGPYTKNQGRFETLGYPVLGSGALLAWVEPWGLLTRMQVPGTFVPAGPDTYQLSTQGSAPPGPKQAPGVVEITVEVAVAGGLVRRVTIVSPIDSVLLTQITIEFTDHGEPVVMTQPTG